MSLLHKLTTEEEIKLALKAIKCKNCHGRCFDGLIWVDAFATYEKEKAAEKNWQDTVDEVSESR